MAGFKPATYGLEIHCSFMVSPRVDRSTLFNMELLKLLGHVVINQARLFVNDKLHFPPGISPCLKVALT